MARFCTRPALVAGVVSAVLSVSLSGADALGTVELTTIFPRNDMERMACATEDNPDAHFPDARATLSLFQIDGGTLLSITVEDARPNTLYSVWLRVVANPLTGAISAPMVPTPVIEELVAVTPDAGLNRNPDFSPFVFPEGVGDDGAGEENPLNGFRTDNEGNGSLRLLLDFPVLKGAYPFQKADLSAFGIELTAMEADSAPVAFKARPFTVVSHCPDDRGHGLLNRVPDDPMTFDQPWFRFDPED